MYDSFFAIGIAFTNFHTSMHKLRDDDNEWIDRHKNRMDSLGKERKRKRSAQQSKYRMKGKRRLETNYRGADSTETSDGE